MQRSGPGTPAGYFRVRTGFPNTDWSSGGNVISVSKKKYHQHNEEIERKKGENYVSDDNPYSEIQFRTLKYRPEFPDRFGCIQDSRAFSQGFFPLVQPGTATPGWACSTPAMVHYNQTRSSSNSVKPFSMPPIASTPNASCARRRNHSRFQPRSGSTNRSTQMKMLTKFHDQWSQTSLTRAVTGTQEVALNSCFVPTARISGIESPIVRGPSALNYFDIAWQSRTYIDEAFARKASAR